MAILKFKRGNTSQSVAYTGAIAELYVNTDENRLIVHDGQTIGGHELSKKSELDSAILRSNNINALTLSSFAHSNASFEQANANYYLTTSSYEHVNSAYNKTNTNYTLVTANFAHSNASFEQANASFDQANSIYNFANLLNETLIQSFDQANGATAIAEASYNQSNVATTIAEASYNQANVVTTIAEASYNQANSNYNFSTTINSKTSAAFDKSNSVGVLAQASFDVANTKLNLSGGEIIGNLQIDGQSNVHQRLSVGTGSYTILPNLIAQFTGTSDLYSQINQQNLSGNGSGDIVVTADNGTDAINFIDLGICGSTYDNSTTNAYVTSQPNDGFLYLVGNTASNFGGNLVIGTSGSSSFADISFVQGTNYEETARFVNNQGFVVNKNITSNTATVAQYLDYNTASEPSWTEGRTYYDTSNHSLNYHNDSEQIAIHIGQEIITRVWNNSGTDIEKGKVVYFTSEESENCPGVGLAIANNSVTSAVIGLTTTNIVNGQFGYIISTGKLKGLNTHNFATGDTLFLSSTNAGELQNTPPSTPNLAFIVGRVIVSDLFNGTLQINPVAAYSSNFQTGAIFIAQDGLITQDNNIHWDLNNHRLGIKTQSPQVDLHVNGDALFTANVEVRGNLLITQAQSISTTELTVGGNAIVLLETFSGDPITDASIIVNRGNLPNASIQWNETFNEWTLNSGTNDAYDHIIDSGKTANSWSVYSNMSSFDKEYYPIGANLANATNELAKTASTTATTALNNIVNVNNLAQAAFNKANTGGVQSITSNSSSRITQNGTTGTILFDLSTSGVTSGTYSYPQLQVDSYGRIININNQTPVTSFNGRTGIITLTSSDVTNSLSYTPVNKTGDTMSGSLTGLTNLSSNTHTLSHGAITSLSYTTTNTSQVVVDSFPTDTYRSSNYQISMTSGSNYHTIIIDVLHNGSSVWLSGYSELFTNISLGSFDSDILNGNLRLLFTPINSSTTINVLRKSINV